MPTNRLPELTDDEQQIVAATKLFANALTRTIYETRPALLEKFGSYLGNLAIAGGVKLTAHFVDCIIRGEPLTEPTDAEILKLIQKPN